MIHTTAQLSFAALLARGQRVDPHEAVAIIRRICDFSEPGGEGRTRVPSFDGMHLDAHGQIDAVVLDDVPAARAVERLGSMLQRLLPDDQMRAARIPAALLFAIQRARGSVDAPPFGSIAEFSRALERFAPADPTAILCGLYARLRPEAGENDDCPYTVSDLRRWRRARSRTSLQQIAYRIGIPHSLLRELEWGYFENWPVADYARRYLLGYAEEARLDPHLVLAIVLPQLSKGQQQFEPAAARTVAPRGIGTGLIAAVAASLVMVTMFRPQWEPSRHGTTVRRVSVGELPAIPPAPVATSGNTVPSVAAAPTRTPPALKRRATRGEASPRRGALRAPMRDAPRADARKASGMRGLFVGVKRIVAGDGTHRVKPFPAPENTRQ